MSNWRTEINTNSKYQNISINIKEARESLVKLTDEQFFSIIDFVKSSSLYSQGFEFFIGNLQSSGGLELIQKYALDLKQATDKSKVYDDYYIKYIMPTVRGFIIEETSDNPKVTYFKELTNTELYVFGKYTYTPDRKKSFMEDDT